MNKNEFVRTARKITLVVDGVSYEISPRQHGTGSVGWLLSVKLPYVLPDGTNVKLQFGVTATVIGSGKWEQGGMAATPTDKAA